MIYFLFHGWRWTLGDFIWRLQISRVVTISITPDAFAAIGATLAKGFKLR